nr:hypothetical protein [uncultured Allomuricauda sp.]
MKKFFLVISLTATLVFLSCSSDDDATKSNCESCKSDAGNTFEICDNGDGTYTASENGVSETITEEDLGGVSVKLAVESACAFDLEF